MDNILGIVSATRDLYGKIKLQEIDLKMVQDLEMVQATGAFAECIEKYLSAISRGSLHPPAARKIQCWKIPLRTQLCKRSKMQGLW